LTQADSNLTIGIAGGQVHFWGDARFSNALDDNLQGNRRLSLIFHDSLNILAECCEFILDTLAGFFSGFTGVLVGVGLFIGTIIGSLGACVFFGEAGKEARQAGKSWKAIMWYSAIPSYVALFALAGYAVVSWADRHDDRQTQIKIFGEESVKQDVRKALDSDEADRQSRSFKQHNAPLPAKPKLLVVSRRLEDWCEDVRRGSVDDREKRCDGELDEVHFLLPYEMHPRTANEVNAIVTIRCWRMDVGTYSSGALALVTDCRVSIVSRATREVLRTRTFSENPPSSISYYPQSGPPPAASSDPSSRMIKRYISGVFR
jgi:hypothetical protein